MTSVTKQTVFRLIVEVLIYSVLVLVYLALVLHFLAGWLRELFDREPTLYAVMSIVLMIAQSVGLERLVASLVHLTRQRRG
jgi:uncharacterized membrane protein YcjF (UPF0283 family)